MCRKHLYATCRQRKRARPAPVRMNAKRIVFVETNQKQKIGRCELRPFVLFRSSLVRLLTSNWVVHISHAVRLNEINTTFLPTWLNIPFTKRVFYQTNRLNPATTSTTRRFNHTKLKWVLYLSFCFFFLFISSENNHHFGVLIVCDLKYYRYLNRSHSLWFEQNYYKIQCSRKKKFR